MRVTHRDHIDPGHAHRDGERGVLHRHLARADLPGAQIGLKAHVHRHHHDIDPLGRAQVRDPLARRRNGIAKLQAGEVVGILPAGHARRGQPDDPDARTVHFLDEIRRKRRLLGADPVSVGRKPRKRRFAPGLLKYGETEIVFVIADGQRVELQRAHCQHHRIRRGVVLPVMKIRERRSLNGVARVDEDQVGVVLARLLDERRRFREADVGRTVRVVIDRENISVQIGRGNDRHTRAVTGRGPEHTSTCTQKQKEAERRSHGRDYCTTRATLPTGLNRGSRPCSSVHSSCGLTRRSRERFTHSISVGAPGGVKRIPQIGSNASVESE